MENFNTINHTGRRVISFLTVLFFTFITAYAGNPEENTYPTTERLFHIARSTNKNLVCYDVNLKNVYWVNREERPGETNGLSFFQKKMAYGYKLISEGNDYSEVTLTAYAGKKLKICKQDSKYVCMTMIDNQPAILESLYVQTKSGSPLSVDYVELRGISTSTGAKVSEKIKK